MKPDEWKAFLQEQVKEGRPREFEVALADLWEAAVEMRAYRMRSVPGRAEVKVHEALARLEHLA